MKQFLIGIAAAMASGWIFDALAADALQITKSADAVVIQKGAKEVLRYVLQKPADSQIPVESACYFHPLTTPSGLAITDVAPEDHRHHRGVFLGWVEMHGAADADFWGWGEHAPVKDRKIVNREVGSFSAEATKAAFTAKNAWMAGDVLILEETLKATVSFREDVRVYDLHYTFTAEQDVTLSRWAFGGFCVRMRKDGAIAISDREGPVTLPPPSHMNPESDWPDRPWYAFELTQASGEKAGVAVINHSENPPTLWHNVAGIGMINPSITAPGVWEIKAGKPLTLRYRVVTFDGATPASRLNALAEPLGHAASTSRGEGQD